MGRIGLVLALGLAFVPVNVAAQAPTVAGAKQVSWLGLVPLPRLMAEFERGMRELGYVEGTTYTLVALYAGDKPETLQSLAAELVRRKPDVIAQAPRLRRFLRRREAPGCRRRTGAEHRVVSPSPGSYRGRCGQESPAGDRLRQPVRGVGRIALLRARVVREQSASRGPDRQNPQGYETC